MTRKILGLIVGVLLAVTFTAGEASARPTSSSGSRTSSGSGTRTTTRTQSTTRTTSRTTATTTRSTATSGRATQAPATTARPAAGTGRATSAPTRTGTKVVASTVRNTTQPTKGAIRISKDTVAGGKTYKVPGTTKVYHYDRTVYVGYYNRYDGGYPTYGTPLYWTLWNDPFYYPNYVTVGSPWYGHPTPVGYRINDGQLISTQHSGTPWMTIFICLLVLLAVAAGAFYIVRRAAEQRANRPFGDL